MYTHNGRGIFLGHGRCRAGVWRDTTEQATDRGSVACYRGGDGWFCASIRDDKASCSTLSFVARGRRNCALGATAWWPSIGLSTLPPACLVYYSNSFQRLVLSAYPWLVPHCHRAADTRMRL